MRIFFAIILLFFLASCANFYSRNNAILALENSFVEGSSDIPLIVGMKKISDDDLGFESNNGSISSTIYSFENDQKKIIEFYINTLDQLGWKQDSSNGNKIIFKRDKQNLSIEVSQGEVSQGEVLQSKKINTIKFFISSML